MKPFDLEKALAGAPVMLRDGQKAYVGAKRPEGLGGRKDAKLLGWFENGQSAAWNKSGRYFPDEDDHPSDIVGMWPVKEKRWIAVTLEGLSTSHYPSKDMLIGVCSITGRTEWQIIEIEVEV